MILPIVKIKATATKNASNIVIHTAMDVHQLMKNVYINGEELYREQFHAIYLNRSNRVLGLHHIGIGSEVGVVCDKKIILKAALDLKANGIILIHNHPSGNASPSDADKTLTKNIKIAAKLLDMDILDHVIYVQDTFYSFANEGML